MKPYRNPASRGGDSPVVDRNGVVLHIGRNFHVRRNSSECTHSLEDLAEALMFKSNTPVEGPRKGILRGPSVGLQTWADWLIEFRRRWRDGDPPQRAHRGHMVLGFGGWLLALVAIIEKALGG
jgi:hypothetical protein